MDELNTTELQKLGRDVDIEIPKTLDMDRALGAIADGAQPKVKTLAEHKSTMEKHIQKYYRRLKSQLPDCQGKCTTHGCPDVVVSRCWLLFRDHIL